jgi:hypothetical protein
VQPETEVSPSTVVPSVKILALKVDFGVLEEVKMLANILRCFPNVAKLHIEVTFSVPGTFSQSVDWHPYAQLIFSQVIELLL